jgi:hypothetical protein
MIDKPGRATPRFPSEKEDVVRDKIAEQLEKWSVGSGDLAICGGARGADILFGELCADRGVQLWLFLAVDEDEFLKRSVLLPNSDWEKRFYDLKARQDVKVFFQSSRLESPQQCDSVFANNNLWMIDTARAEAKDSTSLYAILVWDERPTGDGPGGTSDFASRIKELHGHLAIINPTRL